MGVPDFHDTNGPNLDLTLGREVEAGRGVWND
jgi:hypothetical protein